MSDGASVRSSRESQLPDASTFLFSRDLIEREQRLTSIRQGGRKGGRGRERANDRAARAYRLLAVLPLLLSLDDTLAEYIRLMEEAA